MGGRTLLHLADCEAVILARDEHAARPPVQHRVVRSPVAERQLVRLVACRQREQLVAEADAQDGQRDREDL